jgi:FkbM family methyltransferase
MTRKTPLARSKRFIRSFVKWLLFIPWEIVCRLYLFVLARPSMQIFNDQVLHLALRGKGYNNYRSFKSSGEEAFLKLLATFHPRLCIDIGANKGAYSVALLGLTDSKVIAFEPLPKVFESLRELQAKFRDRLLAVNKGVGDRNTELDLHFDDEYSEWASFSTEINEIDYIGEKNKNSIKVEVVTLDRFFETLKDADVSQIDLLKIDTEGYEYEVLVGAEATLRDKKPKFVQIEYNWHQLFRNQSLFKLASLLPGYVPYQLLPYGSGLSKVDVRKPENNIYYYSNFVFVRKDIII